MSVVSTAVKVLGSVGLYRVASLLLRKQPRILMYHRFSEVSKPGYATAANFEKQLQYIAKHYNVVTMAALAESLYQQKITPKNTVVLTIDDGYEDFYRIAYPLLKKYQLPATLYATTGFIQGELWLWPDQVNWLLSHAPASRPVFSYKGIHLPASDNAKVSKPHDWQYLIDELLAKKDSEKHQIIAELAKQWGLNLPEQAPTEYAACTPKQLQEMAANGIEVGGHTVTHPSLPQVEIQQAKHEITTPKQYLDNLLGATPRSFCYPNGTKADYNDEIEAVVQQAGYNCAVTAFADGKGITHRYALRRHSGGDDLFQFYKSVSGFELFSNRLREQLKGFAGEC